MTFYLYCDFLLQDKIVETIQQVICMRHKHPVAQETSDMVGFPAAE